jgi:glutamate 5-kinase
MDIDRIHGYSLDIGQLLFDHEVIMVSSGSIVTGEALWGSERDTKEGNMAALGSAKAFLAWQDELLARKIFSGQVPVTNHEIASPEGRVLRKSLFDLIDNGIVPIANGNDVLSTEGAEELKIDTDNDRLAGHIAELVEAAHLILLTDEPGLLDTNGEVVKCVNTDNFNWARSLVSEEGNGKRGGMLSKILVAYAAAHALKSTFAHIAHAGSNLQAVISEQVGTHFAPHS